MDHKHDDWWKREAIYQIYPLSFADSDGDGFGDLPGVIAHLDYLHELGVGAIWLSPIFRSPMKDFGYDVADYCDIDPRFGDLAAFDRLVAEAHQRGLKVMLDFVGNHTSDQHPWFLESRASLNNPKRHWYVWADPAPDGGAPNNWLSAFGGSAWTLDETTGQYYLHSFLESQPDLDWHNPEVREAMLNVIRFWCDRGTDGFRCDAIWYWAKDKLLRDDPPNPEFKPEQEEPYFSLLHTMSTGQPELAGIVTDITDVLAEYPGRFMLSEAYALDLKHLLWMYDMAPRHNYAPFNLTLINLPWEAGAYRNFIAAYDEAVKGEDWPNYVLGNHDRRRVASRVGRSGAKLQALLQLTLRGTPIIYNGEELGLENVEISLAWR